MKYTPQNLPGLGDRLPSETAWCPVCHQTHYEEDVYTVNGTDICAWCLVYEVNRIKYNHIIDPTDWRDVPESQREYLNFFLQNMEEILDKVYLR